MKWIALKTQQPPMDTEVLVSDGNYVHEAVYADWRWSSPNTVSGYEYDFDLPAAPLYWAQRPKPPKVNPEDIPEPAVPKKRKYVRPPKKGTADRAIHDLSKLATKEYIKKLSKPDPWAKILSQQYWPKELGDQQL